LKDLGSGNETKKYKTGKDHVWTVEKALAGEKELPIGRKLEKVESIVEMNGKHDKIKEEEKVKVDPTQKVEQKEEISNSKVDDEKKVEIASQSSPSFTTILSYVIPISLSFTLGYMLRK